MKLFLIATFSLFMTQKALAVYDGLKAPENSPEILSTVLVETHFPDNGEYCTGVLIGEQEVLTAAHCFVDDDHPQLEPESVPAVIRLLDHEGRIKEEVNSSFVHVLPGARKEQIELTWKEQHASTMRNVASTFIEYSAVSTRSDVLATNDITVVTLEKSFSVSHRVAKIFDGTLEPNDSVSFAGYGNLSYGDEGDILKTLRIGHFKVKELMGNGLILEGEGLTKVMPADTGGPFYFKKGDDLYIGAMNVHATVNMSEESWEKGRRHLNINLDQEKGIALAMNLSVYHSFLESFLK